MDREAQGRCGLDILKGKTAATEVVRQSHLTVSEIEGWIDEAQRSLEQRFWVCPKDDRE